MNQIVALTFIERYRDDPCLLSAPMEMLHRLAYGADIAESLRTQESAEGFPGQLPTPLRETSARFSEIQGLVRDLASAPVESKDTAASLLAHIFSGAIRIHYFVDGNGRVARFTVQYLLASWGYGFLNLPKIRNDANWKMALGLALSGDIRQLSAEFSKRILSEF